MATRSCPSCGTQYVATVRRCIDCDATLVDEARSEAPRAGAKAGDATGSDDQVAYELEGWGNQLKVTLEGMLDQAGVRRAWEAGALVVAAVDEEVVDDLIATVEGDDVVEPDDDAERLALEIEGLDPDGQAELDAQLIAGAVPHSWDDEGALIVAGVDEDRVLAIIEEVLAGPVDGGDGLVAQQALSGLYVAVDKLVKDPENPKLARAYVEATAGLDGLSVPYGFGTAEWQALVAEASALADRVAPRSDGEEDDDGDGPGISDQAGEADGDDADSDENDGEAPDDDPDGPGSDGDRMEAALALREHLADIV